MKTIYAISRSLFQALFLIISTHLFAGTGHSVQLTQDSIRVTYLQTPNSSTVWGLAIPYYSTSPDNPPNYEVVRSIDGGNTWQDLVTPIYSVYYGFDNLYSIDSLHCWLSFTGTGDNGPIGAIFKTSNGGITWNYQDSSAFLSGDLDFVYFFTPDSGVAVGDPFSTSYFNIWVTSDSGNTWNPVLQANMPSAESGEYAYDGSYNVINGNLYFPTDSNRFFETTDRGYSWTVDTLSGFNTSSYGNLVNNTQGVLLQGIPDAVLDTIGGDTLVFSDTSRFIYSANLGQSVSTGNLVDTSVFNSISIYSYSGSNVGNDFFALGTKLVSTTGIYSTVNYTLLRSTSDLSQPWQAVDSITNNAWLYPNYVYEAAFYSNNLGWIPGGTVDSNLVQQIYTFSDCGFVSPPSLNGLPDSVCSNSSKITLNQGAPAGGTYYVNGLADGIFDPATLGTGVDTVSYRYVDSVGCVAIADADVTVSICDGIEKVSDISLSLYPNPVSTEMIISSNYSFTDAIKPQVYDAIGRMQQVNYQVGNNALYFDTALLPPGVYWVKLIVNGQPQTMKFVKCE